MPKVRLIFYDVFVIISLRGIKSRLESQSLASKAQLILFSAKSKKDFAISLSGAATTVGLPASKS